MQPNENICGHRRLCIFHRCIIQRILTGWITSWYNSYSALNRKSLHREVRPVQNITRTELPTKEEIYTWGCRKNTSWIKSDPQQPSNRLVQLLWSSQRYHGIMVRNTNSLWRGLFSFSTIVILLVIRIPLPVIIIIVRMTIKISQI